ncbi:hypothetical protein TNCT_616861 [Trichonephila clavata]|uniref:Uncharacterized protein n=1 Tax=Trichonephila clavata TaxID=2740835 RepID=A0A8X6FL37_TRICU|nr:hypothetical protein TNCT_616861 [Trichonephila clavata]
MLVAEDLLSPRATSFACIPSWRRFGNPPPRKSGQGGQWVSFPYLFVFIPSLAVRVNTLPACWPRRTSPLVRGNGMIFTLLVW